MESLRVENVNIHIIKCDECDDVSCVDNIYYDLSSVNLLFNFQTISKSKLIRHCKVFSPSVPDGEGEI